MHRTSYEIRISVTYDALNLWVFNREKCHGINKINAPSLNSLNVLSCEAKQINVAITGSAKNIFVYCAINQNNEGRNAMHSFSTPEFINIV